MVVSRNISSLAKQDDSYIASPIENQKSGPYMLTKADALFVAPIGIAGYKAGDEVEVELLCGIEKLGHK
ncbi:MAG: hypothetical protein WC147_09890 [Syntrophomonas sp.]